MTPADILAVTIGCLIGGAITAVMYETSWRWHRRRHTRAPEPASPGRDPESDPPSASAGASAYPAMVLTPSAAQPARPCLCGRPHSDPVHVRTVDLTPPEPEEER